MTFLSYLIIYFIPTAIALCIGHPDVRAVLIFNFFLGLGPGWFAALYFSVTKNIPTKTIIVLFVFLTYVPILGAVAFPSMVKAKINNYKILAKKELKRLSNSIEAYAKDNNGQYPENLTALNTSNHKPTVGLCEEIISMYQYHCEFSKSGYLLTATDTLRKQNPITITIATGGKLFESGGLNKND